MHLHLKEKSIGVADIVVEYHWVEGAAVGMVVECHFVAEGEIDIVVGREEQHFGRLVECYFEKEVAVGTVPATREEETHTDFAPVVVVVVVVD